MKVALTEGGGETFFKPKFLTAFWKKVTRDIRGEGKTFDNRWSALFQKLTLLSECRSRPIFCCCSLATEGQSEERIRKGRNSNCKFLLDNSY